MDKLLLLSGYDHAGPHIFQLGEDPSRTIGHIKMAQAQRQLPPRIEQYIRAAKPISGRTQLLIDALGANEFWGSNVNGDAFAEEALRHPGPEYGFETFMHHAFPFRNHVNKDPARAYGDKVTLSEYDPHMHRVLLIISVDNAKCADILRDLANGTYHAVSMGCRVPFDRCSICGNKARNRSEYCDHLKYQMNKILADGRRVCAFNDKPKFFDISFVMIGAEKASHVLKKVASAEVYSKSSAELGEMFYGKAASTKEADIDKDVPSNLPASKDTIRPLSAEAKNIASLVNDAGAVKASEKALPPSVQDALAGFPLKNIASTLAALGIPLRPEEFQRIILIKTGHRQMAEKLATALRVFDEHRQAATPPTWAHDLAFDEAAVSEKVASILQPYVAARSCYPEILAARLGQMEKAAELGYIYNRDDQWHPITSEQQARSSGISGFVPAGLALATAFMLLKKQFPAMNEKSVVARNPWLLPILLAGGVGASVGLGSLLSPRSLGGHSPSAELLDGMGGRQYDATKTASIKAPWMRLGLIPLAYIYAGIQQRRAERGEPLGAIDRFVAARPDIAAISGFALAPHVAPGIRSLLKTGSVASDVAMYTLGTTSKFMPGVLAGALLDTAIFHGISRLANRQRKGLTNANPG